MLISCTGTRRPDAFAEFIDSEGLRIREFHAEANDTGYQVAVEYVLAELEQQLTEEIGNPLFNVTPNAFSHLEVQGNRHSGDHPFRHRNWRRNYPARTHQTGATHNAAT